MYETNNDRTSWYQVSSTAGTLIAFELLGTPTATPEPSSLLLLGAGLLGLVAIGRSKFARPKACA